MLSQTSVQQAISQEFPTPFAAFHAEVDHHPSPLRQAITNAWCRDEKEAVQWLLRGYSPDAVSEQKIRVLARKLVESVREQRTHSSGVDALMHEYALSSEEGVALMCLAEALLRIPDHETANRLIADKIGKGDWVKHVGESPSMFVNAATWGLVITRKLVGTVSEAGLAHAIGRLIQKGGEPLVRKGVDLAIRMLGNQFVTGQTIDQALLNGRPNEERGYRYSYDMLGEAALTHQDAQHYLAAYANAIQAIGRASGGRGIRNGPGISVKLSALHPRYSCAQRDRVMGELLPRLKTLILLAKQMDIGINIDAEEADRLELSLELMEKLAFDPDLAGFNGIGFVVQAYQKRCPFVINHLVDLAQRSGRKFMVRLVKGAYWDAEIKRAQVDGLPGYPVYTRKVHTDVSYLTCAKKLLAARHVLYPQFATHNAHSLASIYTWAQQDKVTGYEFQCLHGMGEALYDQVVGATQLDIPCRIYAPVGSHATLLAFLVRRLLENGANSSFVNQIVDEHVPVEVLIADPFHAAQVLGGTPHPHIVLPSGLYGDDRINSSGMDLNNDNVLRQLDAALSPFGTVRWSVTPLLADVSAGAVLTDADASTSKDSNTIAVTNPADRRDVVGHVVNAAPMWQSTTVAERADMLALAADLLEAQRVEFIALAIREAGKSFANAVAEVREAVDFLRYYGAQIRAQAQVQTRIQPAKPLGPVVCISPWNFPLAILMGEIGAALAAGNVVLAKPAEQTPIIAFRAIELLHEAGIPRDVLQFLPGPGETIGAALVGDHRVGGVIFTGSTEVARLINQTLAQRRTVEFREIPLIAETGGQNVMIVDSSALAEQVVHDVITSAFDSAGQRCSALRVLCLQQDIADRTIAMLKGAMDQLHIGNPDRLSVDVGPVIDAKAQQSLLSHIVTMSTAMHDIYSLSLPAECHHGTFVAPTLIEIDTLSQLQHEVFGPILHVLRYRREDLPALVDAVNATGFGLTLGIHSRLDETIDFITSHAHVGNIYVNRNIVGAVVGVQPFGGEGKSGTGPKAGGPFYLLRLQHNAHQFAHPTAQRNDQQNTAHRGGIGLSETQNNKIQANIKTALHAFDDLLAWARSAGAQSLLTLAKEYEASSLLSTTRVLPGPTGEINTLTYAPRGNVLCCATDTDSLLNQLAAVFATGNRAVIDTNALSFLPANLAANLAASITTHLPTPMSTHQPLEVVAAIRPETVGDSALASIDIALVEFSEIALFAPALASRTGALVPVIETRTGTAIPIWRLVAERAVCVNTTAAGGNASLMSESYPVRGFA